MAPSTTAVSNFPYVINCTSLLCVLIMKIYYLDAVELNFIFCGIRRQLVFTKVQ